MTKLSLPGIANFIGHYRDEVLGVAGALTTLLDGVALPSNKTAKVREVIAKLENANKNIADAIAKGPMHVTIGKDDIKEAVEAWMNVNAAEIIRAAIAANLKDDGK